MNGQSTYFDYDASGRLLAERDGLGDIIREYIYLDGIPLAQLGATNQANVSTNTPPVTATVDNTDTANTSRSGDWRVSSIQPPYGQNSYDNHGQNGGLRWTSPITEAGIYRVSVWYVAHPQRAAYTVHHLNGQATQTLTQTSGGGTWIELGQHDFAAEKTGYIKLTTRSDGRVCSAGAVRLETLL